MLNAWVWGREYQKVSGATIWEEEVYNCGVETGNGGMVTSQVTTKCHLQLLEQGVQIADLRGVTDG